MLTIVLPGYSSKNKPWVMEVAEKLRSNHTIRPILWDHWDDESQVFNANEKGRLISGITQKDTINIIAKSIGILVASYVIQKAISRINKVIFCGIPLNGLNDGDKEEIKQALKTFPLEKLICIQNDGDPHGSFDQARNFYSDINNEIKVISKIANNHDYPYFEDFERFLKS